MPIRYLTGESLIGAVTEQQRTHMAVLHKAARATSGLVIPRLVAVTTLPDHPPVRRYNVRLASQGRKITPEGKASFQVAKYPGDERAAAQAIERLAEEAGVAILALRPFADEKAAARLDVLDKLPSHKDVDGQNSTKHHRASTALVSCKLVDAGIQQLTGERLGSKHTVAVLGKGPAVGRPAIDILENDYEANVVPITLSENKEWRYQLGEFDAVIGAAGGEHGIETIKPHELARDKGDSRAPVVVADAGFELGSDDEWHGNLHRSFFDDTELEASIGMKIDCLVTPLGVVGAATGAETYQHVFEVPGLDEEAAMMYRGMGTLAIYS